jgi:hypothetical protein
MADTGKWRTALIIGGVILLILAGFGYWVMGIRTLGDILTLMAVVVPVLVVIGLIIFGIWRIFIFKPRYDNLFLNKKKVIETAALTKPRILRDLRLSGDRNHPGVTVGHIIGYTNDYDTQGKLMDVFSFKRFKLPVISWFEEPKAVYVYPEDRSQLAGDVTIYSLNLKQIGGFFFPIDYTWGSAMDIKIKEDIYRTFSFTLLSDLKEISDASRGLHALHQEELERKELFKSPVTMSMPIKSSEGY